MKKIIVIIMLSHIAFSHVATGETGLIYQVQSALRQAEYAVPEQRRKLGYFTEDYHHNQDGWQCAPEFVQLQELVSGNWREVLDNIVEITGDSKIQQVILCASFFSLPQEDFFHCLNRIADLCLSDDMPNWAFLWAIGAYEMATTPMHRFSLNYDNPVVIEVLEKTKIIQPSKSEWCDAVLSGKLKRQLTSYWYFDSDSGTYPNANPELERTVVRIVIGIVVIVIFSIVVIVWRRFRKK